MSKRSGPRPTKPEGATPRPTPEKLPSLDDVARDAPRAGEIDGWFDAIDKMADREAALAYGALMESVLEDALSHSMRVTRPKDFEELFRKPDALLGSWSKKTILAHSLGILSDEARNQMDRSRRIRNAFAHAIRPVDFDNPTIHAEAQKLDGKRLRPHEEIALRADGSRERYIDVAELLIGHLLAYREHIQAGVKDGSIPAERKPFRSRYA